MEFGYDQQNYESFSFPPDRKKPVLLMSVAIILLLLVTWACSLFPISLQPSTQLKLVGWIWIFSLVFLFAIFNGTFWYVSNVLEWKGVKKVIYYILSLSSVVFLWLIWCYIY
jgi:hypothetical protein